MVSKNTLQQLIEEVAKVIVDKKGSDIKAAPPIQTPNTTDSLALKQSVATHCSTTTTPCEND